MTPAIPLFFAAAVGAIWGCHSTHGVVVPAIFCAAAALVFLAAPARGGFQIARAVALLTLGLTATMSLATLERQAYSKTVQSLPLSDGVVVLDAIAADIAPARSGGFTLTLDVNGARIAGAARPLVARVTARMVAGAAPVDVHAGDRILVRGTLRPLLPAYSPGTFDAALFGLSRKTHARMTIFDRTAVAVVERGAEFGGFAAWRNSLRTKMNALATPREAGVLLALIVGDTAQFDQEQLDLYRSVGAGHLLAVSGLQVSLLAVIVFSLARFFFAALPWTGRRGMARPLATFSSLVAVGAFVLLCGAPPSCVRAGVMAAAVLLAALLGRKARALDALGLGGLFTVILSPTSVIDPSFLLSYAAVLGLIAVGAPSDVEREDASDDDSADATQASRLRHRGRQLLAVVASAMAAGVVTLPISAHLFGDISLGGIVANVVLVPVASLLQVPAIGFGLLGMLFSSSFIVEVGAAFGGLLEAITEGLSLLVGGVSPVPPPNGLQTFVLTFAAVVVAIFLGRPRQWGYLALSAVLIVGAIGPSAWTPGGVRMTVLPVGQGDGTVVEMEDGRVLVIDGGGVWDERVNPGEKVVVPFLRRRGIDRVHAVVLSHPDPDHLLGLLDVLRAVPVDELWHSGFTREHPLMRRLFDLATEKGVKIRTARDLAPVQRFGDTVVEVLTPFPEDGSPTYEELSPNENSLTLRIVHGDDSALWPGDLEAWGEHYLLRDGHPIQSTLMKAGHHGSRTSSTPPFIAQVRPEIVIFPTGPDNQWGFPHPEVVERWRATGARLYDTAQHGETAFFLTGKGIVVSPFRVPFPRAGWAGN